MTLPTIIQKQQRKALETAFKKNHSIISQAMLTVKTSLGENVVKTYTAWTSESSYYRHKEIEDAFYETLKIVGSCKYKTVMKNYSKTANALIDRGVTYPDKQLPDGSCINMQVNAGMITISTDINGIKGPNVLGHDVFYFYIDNNDAIRPVKAIKEYNDDEISTDSNENVGNQQGNPCYKNSRQKGNGLGCAYYALINQSPDNPSKKYWENLP